MARKVFVDLDGVLADIDRAYLDLFGVALAPFRLSRQNPPNFWENIQAKGNFFDSLPMMLDGRALWLGLEAMGVHPIVLSGVSEKAGYDAADQKRRWVRRWLGKETPMIFCKADQKCLFASAGDVLIDDWTKHQPKWEAVGGIFIVHTSAEDSLRQLRELPAPKFHDPLKEDELWTALHLALEIVTDRVGNFGTWPLALKDAFSMAIIDRAPLSEADMAFTQKLAKLFYRETGDGR